MGKITVVYDKHGAGHLIGVFNDPKAIRQVKERVRQLDQENYIIFTEVELNELNEDVLKLYS